MPSNAFFKAMNRIHRGLLTLTAGRLGWEVARMPVLKLTTIGRRSGKRRSVMLTSPHQDSGVFVIVASKGGEDAHPAWFLNIRANPQVVVTTKGGLSRTMTARIASPEERRRLWTLVIGKYANYASYQEKRAREIPLVILEAAD
jgi:deazaflavin-dependent oxidoreductase (nitroreductase family)